MFKVVVLSFIFCVNLLSFDIMTENLPPFNFINDKNEVVGISVDIAEEIMKNNKDVYPIKVMPWSRAYKEIINKPNKVLFSMTRTPQREYMFKWVGPVSSSSWVFYAKSDANIVINSLEDAKNDKYKIGTYFDDVKEGYLKDNEFYNLYSVPNDALNLKKLIKGRINLWVEGEVQGLYTAKQLKIDSSKIKKVFTIKDAQLYIAFSRTTPNSVINQWQEKLDMMKKDGRYQAIMDKYLK